MAKRLFPFLRMFGVFAIMTVSHRASAQDPSLVSWWKFDEVSGTTASDSSGSGNNGNLVGTFTRVPGRSGNALNFSGTSYVNNSKPGINFPTGANPRTVAAWIKLPAKVSGTAQILEFDGYNFYVNGGTLETDVVGRTTGPRGSIRIDDGLWHHVASVYEGAAGNFRLYVDGQLDKAGTFGAPNTPSSPGWRIGQSLNGTSSFPGIIDDLRLYNRALPVSEIQALTNLAGIQSLTILPVSAKSGDTLTGTVALFTSAPQGGALVALSADSSAVSVPASVTVPAGANSAAFTISAGTVNSPQFVTITGSFSGTLAQASITVVPSGQDSSLVGWWRLDESSGTTAFDSSGYANTGAVSGSYSKVPGQVGGAIFFGGKSYVSNTKPASAGFPSGSGPRTITAWIKTPARIISNAVIFHHEDHYLYVSDSGTLANGIIGVTKVDDGNWHHVASVYPGPGAKWMLYVDGQLDAIGTSADQNTKAGGNWRIGESIDGQWPFPGAIDEVRFYNRVLTGPEIQSIVTGDGGKLAPVPLGAVQTVSISNCAPKPGITEMNFGDLSKCSIDSAGESRQFRFRANAGDKIWFNLQRTGASASQCYQTTDPDGIPANQTCLPNDFFNGYVPDLIQEQQLTKTGAYIIQVSGGGNATFPFALGLKRQTPLPPQIPQLIYGISAQALLYSAWDWHYYSAFGTAGDRLTVSLNRYGPGVSQCLRIYAPSGQVVYDGCQPNDFFNGYVPTLSTTLTLDQTGGYVFRVADSDNLNSFSYSLAVNCVGVCSNSPVPPPPQVCDYNLSPPSALLASAATGGVLGITAPQGCPWAVSASDSFLKVTTPLSGGGTDTIGYIVDANTSAASRTSIISVGGRSSAITQLGTSPLLSVNPYPLGFNLRAGDQPVSALLSVFTNLPSLPYTASATMDTAAALNWMTISSTAGSAPGTIAVTVDGTKLPPGTFTGSVTLKSPGASPNQIVIPVKAVFQTGGAPILNVSSEPIAFSLLLGGADGTVQRNISNSGAGFLAYTTAVENPSSTKWLSISPNNGSVSTSLNDTISVSASPAGLDAGTFRGAVLISSGGTTIRIPVTMTVGVPGGTILLSQAGLSFTGVSGGGNPSPQSFGILNSGIGTLHWTAKATTLTGGNWLQVDTSSGTVDRPLMDVSLLSVSVDTSRLNAGDYYGKIEISGDALNSPQLITVYVSVLPAGSNPGPEVRPTGLIFVGPPGQKLDAQPVKITNIIGQPVAFTSTQLTFDGATWLSQSPLRSSVLPNVPGTVSVQSDNTKLDSGVLRGVLTLLFEDGRTSNVNVLNVVSPTATGAASASVAIADAHLGRFASSCQSPNLRIQHITLRDGFLVPVTQPTTVSVKVVDDCGNALVPDSAASTPVSASFSNGDADVRLVHEGSGQWSGTWTPTKFPASGSAVTVTVHAAYVKLGSQQTLQTGTASVQGSLRYGSAPLVNLGKVQHAASLVSNLPVAPGEFITIFGSNLADQSGSSTGNPLPSTLQGTQVLLGGLPLPMTYSSSGQINAVVPFGLPVNSQQQIVVSRAGSLSVPAQITVAAAEPGIFTTNQQGTGQGVILHSDELQLAQPGSPANKGEVIVIYCSGLGQVSPNVADGVSSPDSTPAVVNPVSVNIGGADAQVVFAGLKPGLVALYEIQVTVPQSSATGDSVPVTVTVAGQTSNTVTMAVQ